MVFKSSKTKNKASRGRATNGSKTKSTRRKRSSVISGSGGLKSIKKFNWKRNLPIILVVGLVGGYLIWHSFAATRVYGDQYSITQCSAGLTQPSNIQVYPTATSKTFYTDLTSCQDYSAEARVYSLYDQLVHREPDAQGYSYWVQRLAGNRESPLALAGALSKEAKRTSRVDTSKSDEAIAFTGDNLSASATLVANKKTYNFVNLDALASSYNSSSANNFVKNVYQQLLGRSADSGGLNYWVGQLSSGKVTSAKLVATFADTTEARKYFVGQLYSQILGRSADASGLAYWSSRSAATNAQRQATINTFVATNEGNTATGGNAPQVTGGTKPSNTPKPNSSRGTNPSLHAKFMAYVAKHPSPRINPVAAKQQQDRITWARHFHDDMAKRFNSINSAKNDAANVASKANAIGAIQGDIKDSKYVNELKQHKQNMANITKQVNNWSAQINKDYPQITGAMSQSYMLNNYAPDISNAAVLNQLHSEARTLMKNRDSRVGAIKNYSTQVDLALSAITKRYNDYWTRVNNLQQIAQTANQCKAQGNNWNATTATCTAPATGGTSGGGGGSGSTTPTTGGGGSGVPARSYMSITSERVTGGCRRASSAAIKGLRQPGLGRWGGGYSGTKLGQIYYCPNSGGTIKQTSVSKGDFTGEEGGWPGVNIWSVNGGRGVVRFNQGYICGGDNGTFSLTVHNSSHMYVYGWGGSCALASGVSRTATATVTNGAAYVQLWVAWLGWDN